MKCDICGFEAGRFKNGICLECENRILFTKAVNPTVGDIKYTQYKRREFKQLKIWE